MKKLISALVTGLLILGSFPAMAERIETEPINLTASSNSVTLRGVNRDYWLYADGNAIDQSSTNLVFDASYVPDSAVGQNALYSPSAQKLRVGYDNSTIKLSGNNLYVYGPGVVGSLTLAGDIEGAANNNNIKAGAVHGGAAGDIADSTITADDIANSTITGGKIANTTIAAGNIVNDTITATQIAPNAVDTSEIASQAVKTDEIADLTIVDGDISASAGISWSKMYGMAAGTYYVQCTVPVGWIGGVGDGIYINSGGGAAERSYAAAFGNMVNFNQIGFNTIGGAPVAGSDGVGEIYIAKTGVYRVNAVTGSGSIGDPYMVTAVLKAFEIVHPSNPKKALVHSSIEGPKVDLIYRGKVTLVAGVGSVDINSVSKMEQGTFEALCGDVQYFLQNESGFEPVKGKITGAVLDIRAKDSACTDEIAWMVIGERKDTTIKSDSRTDAEGRLITEFALVDEATTKDPEFLKNNTFRKTMDGQHFYAIPKK